MDGHLVSILILSLGLLFCVHCHGFELDIIYEILFLTVVQYSGLDHDLEL